jgi:hypothetical protein
VRAPIVAGVAGGVGTTTVHFLIPASIDGGVYRGGYVDVLVCRSTVLDLTRAHRAVQAVPGKPLLVVVQDIPAKPPRPVRALTTMVEPHVSGVVNLPFVAEWRNESDPWRLAATAASHAEVAKSLRPLQAARRELMTLLTQQLPWLGPTWGTAAHPPTNGHHPHPPGSGGLNSPLQHGRTNR